MKKLPIVNVFILLLMCVYIFAPQAGYGQEKEATKKKPRIAIFPFVDTNEAARKEGFGEAIAGMLMTGIINGANFRVVERSELEKILKEQKFQISGVVNMETAKRIGELYAVDFLLFGSVAKFGGSIETDIRLVDTETGEAILAENANAPTERDTRQMVQELVRKIENRYRLKLHPAPISSPVITSPAKRSQQPSAPVSSGAVQGEMVQIPAGEFLMGNNANNAPYNEKPAHTVYVDAFYMDVTEVTNQQYKAFIEATNHPKPKYWNNSRYNQPDQPVVGVSWDDAAQYAAWAGKRLPTEAEWEYAARGGLSGAKFPWGNDNAKGHACFGKSFMSGKPCAVKSFPPNAYGLYDMAGNVAEWCSDWYRSDAYKDAQSNNPGGPAKTSQKVLRGGSWYEDAYYIRCSARKGLAENGFSTAVGFRCVKSVH